MRVITGTARGRRLREPERDGVRPTTDRVKEGLFSALQFDIPGRRVLDLFAGTGQLGIECLSRGAASAVFVDADRDAARLVRENLSITGLSDRGEVVQGDALAYLARAGKPFDLILLDPPYEGDLLEKAMKAIVSFDILAESGIMTAEHPAGRLLPSLEPALTPRRTYRYGKIAVTLYRRTRPENGSAAG